MSIYEEELNFVDDKLYVYTPIPQYGEGIYKTQLVMTKEIFQECYNEWIKPQARKRAILQDEEGKLGYWIDSSNGWMCSECKRDNIKDTKYCPNCGARMIDKPISEEGNEEKE